MSVPPSTSETVRAHAVSTQAAAFCLPPRRDAWWIEKWRRSKKVRPWGIATETNCPGRTRSATKIELKKRLDEALSLSVSSTMGGSIGQRQSMNLNYSVTKKIQLEGVYELRTNAEGEEDIIDNSIGADLKFRWTFK